MSSDISLTISIFCGCCGYCSRKETCQNSLQTWPPHDLTTLERGRMVGSGNGVGADVVHTTWGSLESLWDGGWSPGHGHGAQCQAHEAFSMSASASSPGQSHTLIRNSKPYLWPLGTSLSSVSPLQGL